jgi:hypothetical protein
VSSLSLSPSPSLAPHLRSSRWRIAIAGLCLVAQAFALVHLFAVRHVRCAEHGEMVHVEGAAGGRAERWRHQAEPSDAATLSASGLAVEAHQDDHCMALSERRDLRTDAVKQVSASPQVLGEVTATYREPRLLDRPIYRLTPKLSPPAMA